MKRLILLISILSFSSACNEPVIEPTEVKEKDPDPDPDPDPVPEIRTMGTRGLFTTSPRNLVMDPVFSSVDSLWYSFYEDGGWEGPEGSIRHYADAPTHQPLLEVEANPNRPGVRMIMGQVRSAEQLRGEIWVGRYAEDDVLPSEDMEISLVGIDQYGYEMAVEWVLADDTHENDGIVWARYIMLIDGGGPLGFANIIVRDTSEATFYVAAPSMVDGRDPSLIDLPFQLKIERRALHAHERELLRKAHERMRERIGKTLVQKPMLPAPPTPR